MGKSNKTIYPKIGEYDRSVEKLFVRILYSNPHLFTRCHHLINPNHYHIREYSKAIKFILDYAEDHRNLPKQDQLEAIVDAEFEPSPIEDDESAVEWFLIEYENFSRYKQLEYIITTKAAGLLQKNDYKTLLDMSKEAVEMGLSKDVGTEYFGDPLKRLEALRQNQNISTGYDALDEKLYGGVERGTLNVICGRSGGGKSIALQNLAINFSKQGLNVAIISLELSEELYGLRMDSMLTGLGTREVMRDPKSASMQVLNFFRKYKGKIFINRMPSGATSLDIRSYLQELETQTEEKIDVLIIDYLDLCHPASTRFKADVWEKDKLVSEELRDVAMEKDLICFTASQLNRQSYEAVDLDGSHIAGGISKINTSDNVFAITSTPEMQKQGVFGLKLMKTRSSAGVGSDIDLAYDAVSMRIENMDQAASGASNTVSVSNLLSSGNTKKKTQSSDDKSSGKGEKMGSSMNPKDTHNQAKQLHDIVGKIKRK